MNSKRRMGGEDSEADKQTKKHPSDLNLRKGLKNASGSAELLAKKKCPKCKCLPCAYFFGNT